MLVKLVFPAAHHRSSRENRYRRPELLLIIFHHIILSLIEITSVLQQHIIHSSECPIRIVLRQTCRTTTPYNTSPTLPITQNRGLWVDRRFLIASTRIDHPFRLRLPPRRQQAHRRCSQVILTLVASTSICPS